MLYTCMQHVCKNWWERLWVSYIVPDILDLRSMLLQKINDIHTFTSVCIMKGSVSLHRKQHHSIVQIQLSEPQLSVPSIIIEPSRRVQVKNGTRLICTCARIVECSAVTVCYACADSQESFKKTVWSKSEPFYQSKWDKNIKLLCKTIPIIYTVIMGKYRSGHN